METRDSFFFNIPERNTPITGRVSDAARGSPVPEMVGRYKRNPGVLLPRPSWWPLQKRIGLVSGRRGLGNTLEAGPEF